MTDIRAINAELTKIGYKAVKLPKPKNRALAWKPQTAAGRACRAAMLYWQSLPPIRGIERYQVKGSDGQWHDESSPLFDAAKAYQKALPRPKTGYFRGNH